MSGLFEVIGIIGKTLDKIIPDPAQRAQAQLALYKVQQDGEFRELEAAIRAITTEAQSADPWTSRARPSFLYVMYLMILAAIPMGVLYALRPELAVALTSGVKAWLDALPEELWWLFGTGYLGYTGARTVDKRAQGKRSGG